jgi:outer membrane lipopolysaccharide assembly protein LptE/RlpB
MKKPAPKKRRRSSKKAPMSMAFVRRMLEQNGVGVQEERSVPTLRLHVKLKAKNKFGVASSFYVEAREVGEFMWLGVRQSISVPKERMGDALKLLQRLHELG